MKTKRPLLLCALVLAWFFPLELLAQPRICVESFQQVYEQHRLLVLPLAKDVWRPVLQESSVLLNRHHVATRAEGHGSNTNKFTQVVYVGVGNAGPTASCVLDPVRGFEGYPTWSKSDVVGYTNILDVSSWPSLWAFEELSTIGTTTWIHKDTKQVWKGFATYCIDNTSSDPESPSATTAYLVTIDCEGDKGPFRLMAMVQPNKRILYTPTLGEAREARPGTTFFRPWLYGFGALPR